MGDGQDEQSADDGELIAVGRTVKINFRDHANVEWAQIFVDSVLALARAGDDIVIDFGEKAK